MIELHAFNTPNGRKISVALEEMGLPYKVHVVDITKDQQFDPAFLAVSPNNKIPAITDPDGPGGAPISMFESGAILLYLGEKTGRFLPRDLRERVPVLEWLMWQMRVRPYAGASAPLPHRQRPGPALRPGTLHEGDAPALRRAGPAAGGGGVCGGGAFGGGFRHPGLGLAA